MRPKPHEEVPDRDHQEAEQERSVEHLIGGGYPDDRSHLEAGQAEGRYGQSCPPQTTQKPDPRQPECDERRQGQQYRGSEQPVRDVVRARPVIQARFFEQEDALSCEEQPGGNGRESAEPPWGHGSWSQSRPAAYHSSRRREVGRRHTLLNRGDGTHRSSSAARSTVPTTG